jgi:hypothetical protein
MHEERPNARSRYVILYVRQSKRSFRVEQEHAQSAALSYVRALQREQVTHHCQEIWKWKKMTFDMVSSPLYRIISLTPCMPSLHAKIGPLWPYYTSILGCEIEWSHPTRCLYASACGSQPLKSIHGVSPIARRVPQKPLPRPRPPPRPPPPRPPPPLPPPPRGPPRPGGPPRPPRSASFLALFFGFGASSMRSVSRGRESGRMIYRMVDPRTVMESSVTVSRFLAVYLTARSAVFIFGETEAIVPLMMVPGAC